MALIEFREAVGLKITEVLASGRYSLSFEVFPPKTDTAFESVRQAALSIAGLSPAFVSVTYGAAGGASRYTLRLSEEIGRTGVPVLVHQTCVGATREALSARIAALRAAGIENVMALRGDLPEGTTEEERGAWPYRHASDVVRALRESGADFCIGAACYPEVHPESPDQKEDVRRLREKVDEGCDFLTTQMFFDNALFYNFLYKIREAGITVPVLPGIMPITGVNQIERAVRLSGSFMPQRFRAMADRFGGSPEAMKQAGITYATGQIVDLFANGIRNVHVYTMNKPDVAAAILGNVSSIVGLPL